MKVCSKRRPEPTAPSVAIEVVGAIVVAIAVGAPAVAVGDVVGVDVGVGVGAVVEEALAADRVDQTIPPGVTVIFVVR